MLRRLRYGDFEADLSTQLAVLTQEANKAGLDGDDGVFSAPEEPTGGEEQRTAKPRRPAEEIPVESERRRDLPTPSPQRPTRATVPLTDFVERVAATSPKTAVDEAYTRLSSELRRVDSKAAGRK